MGNVLKVLIMGKRNVLKLLALLAVVFVLLLSGCGSSDSGKQGAAVPEKQEANSSGAYTVTDLTGTKVSFPEKPRR